ncbi:MAG TPA: carboxypeptidase regulatory-like domain-containing protein [Pyrinomonadaceae bacterium]|nr:carboxypeptidase regulatory-like domain-containing protein [Pyrinomonadaceae bacterium]
MNNSHMAKSLGKIAAFSLSLLMMIFIFSLPVMAQATTGELKGTVVDQNGAAVPGATVTAKNDETGIETTVTASGDGGYDFPRLAPGKYTITAEGSGFKKTVTTGVTVSVGVVNPLDVKLEAGAVSETVTVTADTEQIVNRDQAQQSTTFETRKVEELPSNSAGGGIDTLALLAPGVVPGFGNVNSNGTTLSVNGNRARSNNFTLDGTDNNDLTIGGPNFFIDNQDAVQEFQLITNNFSAQYGRNQGAIVNIVTKGGTNEFHGSAFEFHRNASALDAMTNAERADPNRSKKDKFISNVFGGTFGGPIVKNKAFFFVDGQLIRQRQTFLFQAGNPAILPSGLATLAANFPGNPAIAAIVNQSVFALQPTARVQGGGTALTGNLCFPKDFTQPCTGANAVLVPTGFPEYLLPLPFDQKEYGLRGDINPTSKDSLNVKYRFQSSPETNADSQSNGWIGDVPFKSRNLNGQWTRQVTSRLVNNVTAAWQKLQVTFGDCTGSQLTGCQGSPAQIGTAFTNITFTGIRAGGVTLQSIGVATNIPQGRAVRVAQFADSLSWTKGKHTMLFGVDLRDLDNSVPFLPNLNGAFRFGAPPSPRPCTLTTPPTCSPFATTARIVANAPNFVTIVAGQDTIVYKERDQFYYFQDDFKVRENFTLNLGVRYEYTGQPINTLHDLTLARESDSSTAIWRQSLPIDVRTVPKIPVDKNNFAPRFGFAWVPHMGGGSFNHFLFGDNDATVIRGGYSIAYDPAFYNILLNVSTSTPTVFNNTINNTCTTPPCSTDAGFIAQLTSPVFRLPANPTGDVVRAALGSQLQKNTFDPRFFNETVVGPDFHAPYSQQWSIGVQRQINRNNVAEIRYVGNHGVGLFQTINRNPDIRRIFNGFTLGGVTFPGFPQLLHGAVPLTCTDNPATLDNEGVCNGRILPQGNIRSRENTASSTYNGLQMRYNGRLFNQLTLGAAYTFSKTLDNASEVFSFGEGFASQNPLDINAGEKGFSGNDRRHASSINALWDIPFFKKQEGFTGHFLGGWQVNGTYVLASGRPWTPLEFCNFGCFGIGYEDIGFDSTFLGFDTLRPFRGNPNAPRDSVGITSFDGDFLFGAGTSPTGFWSLNALNQGNLVSVTPNDVRFIFNGPGAAKLFGNPFGDVLRNSERGPALNQLNIGIFKTTNLTERVKIQFRTELFNALNHPNVGYGVAFGSSLPDQFLEDAGNGGGAGTFNGFNDRKAMELSSRRVQFGLRIIF